MKLSFSVKFDKNEKWKFDGVDAYGGTKALLGFSQVLLLILHAAVHEEVLIQTPYAKGVRVVLGRAKEGSLEQLLTMVTTDPQSLEVLRDLGKDAIYDLIKWALLSGVGVRHILRSRKAKKRIEALERDVDDLQERLDHSIRDIHLPIKKQGLKIEFIGGRTIIAKFDEKTLEYLEVEVESPEAEIVYLAISRFNARTGWGRCISGINEESTPFSPADRLTSRQKSRLADNLSLVARGRFEPIAMRIKRISSSSGVLKRYRLLDVPEMD
jgi:hypothetical protein